MTGGDDQHMHGTYRLARARNSCTQFARGDYALFQRTFSLQRVQYKVWIVGAEREAYRTYGRGQFRSLFEVVP